MALVRIPQQKKPREPHHCVPIKGEFGRFTVNSASAAKQGLEEAYIVDVLAVEETSIGKVTGTCGCRGWEIRKTCSHVVDATAEHARLEAEKLGFTKLD